MSTGLREKVFFKFTADRISKSVQKQKHAFSAETAEKLMKKHLKKKTKLVTIQCLRDGLRISTSGKSSKNNPAFYIYPDVKNVFIFSLNPELFMLCIEDSLRKNKKFYESFEGKSPNDVNNLCQLIRMAKNSPDYILSSTLLENAADTPAREEQIESTYTNDPNENLEETVTHSTEKSPEQPEPGKPSQHAPETIIEGKSITELSKSESFQEPRAIVSSYQSFEQPIYEDYSKPGFNAKPSGEKSIDITSERETMTQSDENLSISHKDAIDELDHSINMHNNRITTVSIHTLEAKPQLLNYSKSEYAAEEFNDNQEFKISKDYTPEDLLGMFGKDLTFISFTPNGTISSERGPIYMVLQKE